MQCKQYIPSNLIHLPPVAYIDKVGLRLPVRPAADFITKLREACGVTYEETTARPGKKKSKRARKPRDMQRWWWVNIVQPTPAVLELLVAMWGQYKPSPTLSALEIALDLPTATEDDAEVLGAWVNHRIMQPHRRERGVNIVGGTRYTNAMRWGQVSVDDEGNLVRGGRGSKGIVTYSDRSSKITNTPCAHLEYRFAAAQYMKNAGFSHPADLLQLDAAAWWREKGRLVLRELDYRHLRKQVRRLISGMPDRRKRKQALRRMLIANSNGEEIQDVITSQGIHDTLRGAKGYRLNQLLPKINVEPLLPHL